MESHVPLEASINELKREQDTLKTQTEFNSANLDNLQYQIESQLQITSSMQVLEVNLSQRSKNLD